MCRVLEPWIKCTGLGLELAPSHSTRAVRGSSEHLPFTSKNAEAQRRERDLRGSALCETKQS